MIFKRYVELGSIGKLRCELEAKGIKPKSFVSTRGKSIGGSNWYVGPLRHLLRNPVYVGLAVHKGKTYPGQHEAIVAKPLFDKVQEQLSSGARTWQRKRTIEASGLLTGLVYDDKGNRMSPQWSIGRNKTKHGYYVSQALLQRRKGFEGSLPRVSAPLIEEMVLRCVKALQPSEPAQRSPGVVEQARASPEARHELAARVRAVVANVVIKAHEVVIELKCGETSQGPNQKTKRAWEMFEAQFPVGASTKRTTHGIQITIAGRLKRHGGIKRIEGWSKQDWSIVTPRPDKSLLAALGRAHRWREAIERGNVTSVDDLAARENLHRRRVREILRIAFLAPDIQKAILEGRQPAGLNLERLSELGPPAAWSQQRKLLGLGT